MTGLIREDVISTISKKRFIILTALAFAGAVVSAVITRNGHWNDLTYFFGIQKYITDYFDPLIGTALILSVYRRKFTRNSILQVEEKGLKRSAGVLSKTVSGALILAACYLVMAVLVILLGLILGAHMSAAQTGQILLRLLLDCLAAVVIYIAALFFLYLFAFPLVPVIVYVTLMTFAVQFYHNVFGMFANNIYLICCFIDPKINADNTYTLLLLSGIRLENILIFPVQAAVPLLLSLLVFRLKKLKPLKKDKNEPAENAVNTEVPESNA